MIVIKHFNLSLKNKQVKKSNCVYKKNLPTTQQCFERKNDDLKIDHRK